MKFPYEEKALFYAEMAKLHGAGFPLTEALDAVADTSPPEATRAVINSVREGIAASETIGESFARSREVELTELESSIIVASERGGVLGEGFEHLARYFRMRHATAREMRRRMIYPLALLHFAILIPVIPLMIGSPNPNGVLLVSLGVLLAVYALLFFVVVMGKRLAVKAVTNPATDGKLARVPLLGEVRKNLALSRFCSVYRMHLLAGERIDVGLRSAASASGSARVVESIKRHALPLLNDGKPVGPGLAEDPGVFTKSFASGFITAEKSGTLDTDLVRWTTHFQDGSRAAMEKLGSRAPRVFYVLIVLIALWQIFRMVAKIFGIYSDVFKLLP